MDVALWVAVIGVGGTLSAQIVSGFFGWLRDRERQSHERLMEKERRENEERIKQDDSRQAAYERFAALVTVIGSGGNVTLREVADTYSAAELRASEPVREVARELFMLAAEASEANRVRPEDTVRLLVARLRSIVLSASDKESRKELMTRIRNKRGEFRRTVRLESDTKSEML